jgi:1,4-alpha-glucan branching enzyme
LFFIFNFHPSRSLNDYPIEMLPGEYTLVMDTDESRFGGQNRLAPGQHYFTIPMVTGNLLRHCVRTYLPCRTAIVLRSTKTSKKGARRKA